jgi:hypothetical protein
MEGDTKLKPIPGKGLEKSAEVLLERELQLLSELREYSAYTSWEPTIGGKFPKQQYDDMTGQLQRLVAMAQFSNLKVLSNY